MFLLVDTIMNILIENPTLIEKNVTMHRGNKNHRPTMSIPILVNENKRWKAKKLSDVNGSGFLVDLTYTVH